MSLVNNCVCAQRRIELCWAWAHFHCIIVCLLRFFFIADKRWIFCCGDRIFCLCSSSCLWYFCHRAVLKDCVFYELEGEKRRKKRLIRGLPATVNVVSAYLFSSIVPFGYTTGSQCDFSFMVWSDNVVYLQMFQSGQMMVQMMLGHLTPVEHSCRTRWVRVNWKPCEVCHCGDATWGYNCQ